ncbi:helix-turn-helix transcriptional regulator [Stenotrophomonas sp. PS02298]|uniref:helix-turn-helix domain-containing protein n=1 Tax=Stenotrophomonas sp. PS02298 TaxID=2991424 RepID=UPI00249A4F97|nr:helix-turn-helix transcriptional regulator [Stenotrophomonas sp. PS02298]
MVEHTNQAKLADVIRAHRVALGLSQEGFADHIEMHRAYYSKIERGEKNVTLATLERVAVGLGTSMSALLLAAEL